MTEHIYGRIWDLKTSSRRKQKVFHEELHPVRFPASSKRSISGRRQSRVRHSLYRRRRSYYTELRRGPLFFTSTSRYLHSRERESRRALPSDPRRCFCIRMQRTGQMLRHASCQKVGYHGCQHQLSTPSDD